MKKMVGQLSVHFAHMVVAQLATMVAIDLYITIKNRKKEPIGFRTK